MGQYLIVANETALSLELNAALLGKLSEDNLASFSLLVPATPINRLLVWDEGSTRAVAAQRAFEASASLRLAGFSVNRAMVGDASPLAAIVDELRRRPGLYAGVFISTHPPRISRWLRVDIVHQAARLSGLPTYHVVASHPLRELARTAIALTSPQAGKVCLECRGRMVLATRLEEHHPVPGDELKPRTALEENAPHDSHWYCPDCGSNRPLVLRVSVGLQDTRT